MRLSGWGHYPVVDARLGTCRYADEAPVWLQHSASLIPRGNGRAYGDAALNRDLTLSTLGLDRIIELDPGAGRVTAEAGVLLSDLLQVLVPRGWLPPVLPGTRFVTLGGMAAADVHGKNHHGAGSFARHIECLDLLRSDGETVTCSPTDNAELFNATLGGMGLTGLILRLRFRLLPIASAWMRQETIAARDLDEIDDAFERSRDWTYTVAWIDCLARGPRLGRSLLYRGEHATPAELPADVRRAPLAQPGRTPLTVPFFLPRGLLNGTSVRLFNSLYFRHHAARTPRGLVDLDSFFFPLDAIDHWNRIYGRRGFFQYQCVLPIATGRRGLRELLSRVARAGAGSFLAVLKPLGPGRGGLSFPLEGYTLALDFPATATNLALAGELDAIVADHGGRIYLAKDARAAPEVIAAGYPDLEAVRAWRDERGGARFESVLSERLGL